MSREWTEDQIAAWVDGSLDPDQAARIAAMVANDPSALQVAERVERQNALLRTAYADTLDQQPPARLLATVFGGPTLAASGGVIATTPVRPAPAWKPMALAAGLALAIGLGTGAALVGVPAEQSPEPSTRAALAVGPADPVVAAALETSPSGEAGAVTPLATFRVVAGGWCREFETETGAGVGCRDNAGGWSVVAAAVRPAALAGQAEGYLPAGGDFADTLGAALDALGAGAALDPDAEAQTMAGGWR